MKILPTYGPSRSRAVIATSLTAAAMLVGMLLAQLFAFEDFPVTLGTVLPLNDQLLGVTSAAVVVLLELLALPYLLGMYISRLMRIVSAASAGVVAGFWLMLALTNSHAENSGLFSTTLEVPGGLLAAAWSVLLAGCIVRVIVADSRFRHSTTS